MVDIPSRSMSFTCGPREDDCAAAAHRIEGESMYGQSRHLWLGDQPRQNPQARSRLHSPSYGTRCPRQGPYDLRDMLR